LREDVYVSNVTERWTGCWEGDLPLLSSLRVFMRSSCQRECHGKVDGKKIVVGKERRVKIFFGKGGLLEFLISAIAPLTTNFLLLAKFGIRIS
jgi:hypothetical protein